VTLVSCATSGNEHEADSVVGRARQGLLLDFELPNLALQPDAQYARLSGALGSMAMRNPSSLRMTVMRNVGRALGIGCYLIGTVVRSRSLRALGLPSVAERNFRRKNYDSACVRAVELLQLVETDPND
jgi:hypothetical protein